MPEVAVHLDEASFGLERDDGAGARRTCALGATIRDEAWATQETLRTRLRGGRVWVDGRIRGEYGSTDSARMGGQGLWGLKHASVDFRKRLVIWRWGGQNAVLRRSDRLLERR